MKRLFTLIICALFLSSCSSTWDYTPRNWRTKNRTASTIQVSQFNDARNVVTNDVFKPGKFILHEVPLILWSNITDVDHPEGNVIEMPNMVSVLPKATATELSATGMFKDVFVMSEKAGTADYTLKGTIIDTHSSKTISAYGLSVIGNMISLLGVPSGKVKNTMTVKYQLLDKNNKVIFDKTYTENSSRPIFIYTELSKSQFEIQSSIYQNINIRLIKDLSSVIGK